MKNYCPKAKNLGSKWFLGVLNGCVRPKNHFNSSCVIITSGSFSFALGISVFKHLNMITESFMYLYNSEIVRSLQVFICKNIISNLANKNGEIFWRSCHFLKVKILPMSMSKIKDRLAMVKDHVQEEAVNPHGEEGIVILLNSDGLRSQAIVH